MDRSAVAVAEAAAAAAVSLLLAATCCRLTTNCLSRKQLSRTTAPGTTTTTQTILQPSILHMHFQIKDVSDIVDDCYCFCLPAATGVGALGLVLV